MHSIDKTAATQAGTVTGTQAHWPRHCQAQAGGRPGTPPGPRRPGPVEQCCVPTSPVLLLVSLQRTPLSASGAAPFPARGGIYKTFCARFKELYQLVQPGAARAKFQMPPAGNSQKRRANSGAIPAEDRDGADEPAAPGRARKQGRAPQAGVVPQATAPPVRTAGPSTPQLAPAPSPARAAPPPQAAARVAGSPAARAAEPEDSQQPMDFQEEDAVELDTSLEGAGVPRRQALRVRASIDEVPAGYNLDPIKVTHFNIFHILSIRF